MNVEIVGIHPHNKGALLMLAAIREQVSLAFPQARFAVPFDWPTEGRLAEGLWCTIPRDFGPSNLSPLANRIPSRLRNAVGLMAPSDLQVILDASGFGYGDYWGPRKLARRAPHLRSILRKRKQTLILLPQALGPFESPGMAAAFRRVLDAADLVYVRDATSMKHIDALGPRSASVRSAPDFTNLLHPQLPERLNGLRGASMIVPNQRVAGNDPAKLDAYLSFLAKAASALQRAGRRLSLLVHEGEGDLAIAAQLNARLGIPLPIINESSPLVTKAIIGAAALTVSSRYHALVSALAAGVPSLACGWSHKYGELMSAYGCPELEVQLDDPSTWHDKITSLERLTNDPAFGGVLETAARNERDRTEAMWDEVLGLLRSRYA